jgi:hypothetical protein
LTAATTARPSALVDPRVIYCGDNLEADHAIIIPFTVKEILDEQIIWKLA